MAPLMLTLVSLVAIITGSDAQAAEPCPTAEHANGCRAPFGLDIAYETLFEPYCNTHTLCYSCGADFGFTKQTCDEAFLRQMYEACEGLADPATCKIQADNVYSLSIRVIGSSYFHASFHTLPFCIEHWVGDCLPSLGDATTTSADAVVGR